MTTPTLQEVETMERAGLLALWAEMFGDGAPKHMSAPLIRRVIAFELQAAMHGGLDRRIRSRLEQIAKGGRKPLAPGLKRGARLVREWNGVQHIVDVVEGGFVWRGETHRSLTAIARAITGAHWSGPRFFGLGGKRA